MSEIVAKWIVSTGIDPALLVDTTDTEFDQMKLTNNSFDRLNMSDETSSADLKQDSQTSVSLPIETEKEVKTDTTACTCILGKCIYIFIIVFN